MAEFSAVPDNIRADLVPWGGVEAVAQRMTEGVEKHGERGGRLRSSTPLSVMLGSLRRHLADLEGGDESELHGAALAANALMIADLEARRAAGLADYDLWDVPIPSAPHCVLLDSGAGRSSLMRPDPSVLTPQRVAYGLAGVHRWGGQTRPRLTVAEHSVLVAKVLEGSGVRPALGLLHDAAEAVGLGDVTMPWKRCLVGIDELERRWLAATYWAFRVPVPDACELQALKDADRAVAFAEAVRLLPGAPHGLGNGQPASVEVSCWSADEAEARWLESWEAARR